MIDVDTLLESIDHVLDEADLAEEWMRARWDDATTDPSSLLHANDEAFDAVMRSELGGTTLRDALRDPKLRATVRRAVYAALGS